mgnify:CR=1 FL=1
MQELTPLALPPAPLKLKRQDNKVIVQCLIRRKYLVLTPEEWVRQHLISFLNLSQGFALEKISVEKQIRYDGFTKRWDIVVFDAAFNPFLLIECKAPSVPISSSVMEQISVYQRKVQAPYLALSNGLSHQVFALDAQAANLQTLEAFPSAN